LNFEEIVGNNEVKEYLTNCLAEGNLAQTYLFVGTEGIGKSLIAKTFAKKILCLQEKQESDCHCKSCQCFEGGNHPDYYFINEKGETIKIEQIREITSKVIEQPIQSHKKVYIINDADKMTIEAQNCFLKTLEEPPEFAVIVLITANENAILNTIKSRCMTIKFEPIPKEELKKYATDKLGITQMTENLLKSFNGSIGKAIVQKEEQEKFLKIENIINNMEKQDIITFLNDAKVIYDKENINRILEYMMIGIYEKSLEDKRYMICIEKINHGMQHLKRNCNFDMTIDTMLLEMWECFQKGI